MEVKWMVRKDMPHVLRIEKESFEQPLTEEDFVKILRERNVIGMVAKSGTGEVLAFMLYELLENKFRLLDFAVGAKYRRRGIGRQLLNAMRGKLKEERRRSIVVEIADDNLAAHLFFRSAGYRAVRVHRGKAGDSYLFRWHLNYESALAKV